MDLVWFMGPKGCLVTGTTAKIAGTAMESHVKMKKAKSRQKPAA